MCAEFQCRWCYLAFSYSPEQRLLASSYPSDCLSFCPHVSAWLREIWYWRHLLKFVEKLQISLKSDNSFGHFTRRAKFILLLPVTDSSEYNFLWTLSTSIMLTVSHSSTTHVTHCYVPVTTVAIRKRHYSGLSIHCLSCYRPNSNICWRRLLFTFSNNKVSEHT